MKLEFTDLTFVEWAHEREKIRRRKEDSSDITRGLWTPDPILSKYSFCNVSREDDATTKVVKEYVRDPMDKAGAPKKELFKALAVCRFFNHKGVIKQLVEKGAISSTHCDLEMVHDICGGRMEQGEKTFHVAYVVGAPPGQLVEPFFNYGKVSYVCSIVHRAAENIDRFSHAGTRESFVKALRQEVGFKDFMAGQIAADLAYTYWLENAPDHFTWAPFGPGAVQGMLMSMGLPPAKTGLTEGQYLDLGSQAMEHLGSAFLQDFRDRGVPLTAHDVFSNVFCETAKYLKARKGLIMPKRLYK